MLTHTLKGMGVAGLGYRLVALDVDGTIRSQEHPLSDYTRSTIARVEAAGAVVTLATGRTYKSAVRAADELGLSAPIATFQGAHVALPTTGEVLWHVPLTADMTHQALAYLANVDDVEVLGYPGNDVFVMEMTEWAGAYGDRNSIPVHVAAPDDFVASPMTRLVVRGEDDHIERLVPELRDRFAGSMYVTRSLSYFCEILNPEGGKDKALSWLGDHLGVGRNETIAFGNGYNDVQMLEWAEMSVAVEGAVPDVLDVVDLVAPPMEKDGVARVLNNLLDKGMIG